MCFDFWKISVVKYKEGVKCYGLSHRTDLEQKKEGQSWLVPPPTKLVGVLMDFIVSLTESLEKDTMEGKPEDKLAEHPLINNITLVLEITIRISSGVKQKMSMWTKTQHAVLPAKGDSHELWQSLYQLAKDIIEHDEFS